MSSFNCVTKRYDLNTDWEQRKLDDVSETSIGGGTPATTIKKYWNGEIPWIQSSDLKKNKYFDVDIHKFITTEAIANSAAKLIKKDSITIVTRVGVGKLALIGHDFTTSQDFLSLSNLKIDKLFGIYSISKILDSAVNSMQGTSIKGVTKKELLKYNITLPSNSEQTKVGKLLKNLDNAIALHLFKLETLKKLKQGYLHVMFPENQHPIPYLRFANFSAPWEQRKLGDLGSVAMNKRIFKEQTSEFGDIPFFKIGTFGGNPDAFISRKLYDEYKTKYAYPKIGDILISASGSIGKMVEYQGKDEYFQDSNIIWFKHDNRINNKFLKQFYLIVKWQGLEGSTIKRLYNRNVLSTIINIPSSLEEQKIVSTFLERLDNTIALHQAKIEKLQRIKKSYLQKMFI